jgi:uncharacterized protein (DUF1501 family)
MTTRALDRRELVVGGASLAGAAVLGLTPGCGRGESRESPRAPRDLGGALVLLELTGGADGLSLVVPVEDDLYQRARPTTRISKGEALALDPETGWHPSLRRTAARYQRGQVAIVEGCGYPEPIYSHFRALEVWHTARVQGRSSGDGWIGRLRSDAWGDDPRAELVLHVGGETPYSLASRSHPPLSFKSPESLRWVAGDQARRAFASAAIAGERPAEAAGDRDALLAGMRSTLSTVNQTAQRVLAATSGRRPGAVYPEGEFGDALRTVAALIDAGFPTRVYSLSFGNFDSHGAIMRDGYFRQLEELDETLDAFLEDVGGTASGAETLVLAFTEFGRRVQENRSRGTDHGAAAPMFLVGPRVRGGRHGAAPSLGELDGDGNLVFTTDFRRVYATVLRDAFGVQPESVLGDRYEPLPLIA